MARWIEDIKANFRAYSLTNSAATYGIASPFIEDSHLDRVTIADLWPDTDPFSVVGIGREGAMKVGTAAKARNMICGAISGMPLEVLRGRAVLEEGNDLIFQPERGRARAVTMAWTVDQMLWHGQAWWRITERFSNGRPKHVAFEFTNAVQFDPQTQRVTIGNKVYPFSDFICFEAIHEGALKYGKDVLVRAALTELAAAKASNNPVPTIELHQTDGDPLSNDERKDLVDAWIRARTSTNGGVAFTGTSVDVKTHGVHPEQLLIDGRNAYAKDVARVMGLPAWAVDASVEGSSLTYSNVPSRSRELLDYTLHPYMDAICGRLSLDDVLPNGQWCRMNPQRLLKGDFTDRMNAGETAIRAGIYTPEEIRMMEQEIPLED